MFYCLFFSVYYSTYVYTYSIWTCKSTKKENTNQEKVYLFSFKDQEFENNRINIYILVVLKLENMQTATVGSAILDNKKLVSFTPNSSYDSPRAAMITKLAEVDALPCAQVKMTVRDGDVDADTADGALGVCRHVVGSFEGVHIIGGVLRNQPIEDVGKVGSHIRISILIDG